MSILIKGMEMPDCCTRCDYLGLNVAIGCPVMTGVNGRATDCPLIEIPPHGRLIDADAINHEDEIWKKKCIPQQVVYNAWVVAGEMPTVIPADKDGET